MLKLVRDVKCGFKELFITEKDVASDLAIVLEMNKDCLEDDVPEDEIEIFKAGNPTTEEELYNMFKDDIDGLLQYLDDHGLLESEEEAEIEYYGHTYFSAICKEEKCLPGYYEEDNYRLIYEPNVKSDFYFENAMTAQEVFKFLGINKQQLYYYVKTGKIKKEYNKDATQVRYNKRDVYRIHNEQFDKKTKTLMEMTGCTYDEAVRQLLNIKDKNISPFIQPKENKN